MKVTLRDVAGAAGVAESTASRALAGSGQLADSTRQKVMQAAEELGYELIERPRLRQPSLSTRRGAVGVVVAALHNSFYPYLVDRLHNELDELGFDMVLIIDEITHDRAGRKLRSLIDLLDGVIVTTAMIDSPMTQFLADQGVPTVLAIRASMQAGSNVVESDNLAAGAEALHHLIDLGHSRIGFMMGPPTTSTSLGRLTGAQSAMADRNIAFDEAFLLHTDFTHEGGYSGFVQLMRQAERPTAIFCANDVIAIGAMDAARKMNLDVPSDVSIIGVDDIPMASWSMISLTTIRQPIGEIGSISAKLIAKLISEDGGAKAEHHILPTSLVQRSSTGRCS